MATIDEALARTGMSDASVSKQAVGHLSLIKNMRNGRGRYSFEALQAIAKVLDLECYFGPPREEGAAHPSADQVWGVAEIAQMLGLSGTASVEDVMDAIEGRFTPGEPDAGVLQEKMAEAVRAGTESLHAELAAVRTSLSDLADTSALASVRDGEEPPDARPVDVMELASAAGGGAEVLGEEVSGRVWFRRDWLDAFGLNAARCVVIGVMGESMEPTLMDGSKILIDRERTGWRRDDIFVIRGPDGLVVKRAGENADGERLMVSDHPKWEDAAWPDEAEVLGRVVWTARTLVGV